MTINSFAELDDFLNYVEALNDDDAMRKHWSTLKLNPSLFKDFAEKIKKLDPFTDQYYDLVQDFFSYLQGRKYHISNEGLLIDVELMTHIGYPYSTRSSATVGAFLIAYGFIIRAMNIPIPARILDIGTGVGALTQHLAKMGYDLTCVDVNNDFLEVIRRTSISLPNQVDCVLSNMEELDLKQQFDAVLFMESFHHSLNHRETLKKAVNHLKPNGIIAFAAEPIIKSETDYLPYPWGPRLDGESIRAIRKHGWIELGFSESYFYEMLRKSGLHAQRFSSSETHWADVIITRPYRKLQPGKALSMRAGQEGTFALLSGWSQPEPFGTWTDGSSPTICFIVEDTPETYQQLQLNFELIPFLAFAHTEQQIKVFINEHHVETWLFNGTESTEEKRTIIFLKELLDESKIITIRFQISSPISPSSLGLSNDTRQIGLGLISISLDAWRK